MYKPASRGRLSAFDVIRGFSLVSMMLFHLCYDIRFVMGRELAFFSPPLIDIWRASISWVFVFIAGCMFCCSRNNLKRAAKYLVVALLIYVVTALAQVDIPISFGIIYCMGACTLASWLLGKAGVRHLGLASAIVFFCLFLFFLHVPSGYVGLAGLRLELPDALYQTPFFSWAGFPGPGFESGDYYPLLPYLFLYLAGWSMMSWAEGRGLPRWVHALRCAPLEFLGQHSLEVYILHQPVILVLVQLLP